MQKNEYDNQNPSLEREEFYTAGEMAKLSGVSPRAIRFYDQKGLLKPVGHTSGGYRYYNQTSFAVLQRILMFKYLGFSLSQIAEMLQKEDDANGQEQMKKSLAQQKQLLAEKQQYLQSLIESVEMAETCNETQNWEVLLKLLNLMSMEEKTREQYRNSENLKRRINIHSYNTNPYNWMNWVYDHYDLKAGGKVLELGCGNALLWCYNIDRLPEKLTIYLTDFSEGMLEEARKNMEAYEETLQKKNIQIIYRQVNANELVMWEKDFDLIIANHMIYHVQKKNQLLEAVIKMLKPEGKFYCTTVGEGHMQELDQLIRQFDETIETPLKQITGSFCLENAEARLSKYFAKVQRDDYLCDLLVKEPQAIFDYVYSYPGNAGTILDKKSDAFLQYIKQHMKEEGSFFIHKATGIFVCRTEG